MAKERPWVSLPIGLVGGALSGLFGLGGGIIVVPALQKFGRFQRLEAQALSLGMMLPPVGLPALWVYAHEEHGLDWPMVIAVALGFSAGGVLGGKLGVSVDAKTAARAFAVVLVVSATLLIVRSGG